MLMRSLWALDKFTCMWGGFLYQPQQNRAILLVGPLQILHRAFYSEPTKKSWLVKAKADQHSFNVPLLRAL